MDNPYSKTGGLAVLKGNLAPDGSVVKRSAVVDEMMVHEGPARVFECEEDFNSLLNQLNSQAILDKLLNTKNNEDLFQ